MNELDNSKNVRIIIGNSYILVILIYPIQAYSAFYGCQVGNIHARKGGYAIRPEARWTTLCSRLRKRRVI